MELGFMLAAELLGQAALTSYPRALQALHERVWISLDARRAALDAHARLLHLTYCRGMTSKDIPGRHCNLQRSMKRSRPQVWSERDV